jgi:hypothetical protein
MPIIFTGNTGRVTALVDSVAAGSFSLATVKGDGAENITYQTHRSIITKVGMSSRGNYQFFHTIGDDVYVYVFGDRMGEIAIHGISFQSNTCLSAGTPASTSKINPGNNNQSKHGFELLYQWYLKNRISANAEPILITLGSSTPFFGFVTSLTSDLADPLSRTVSYRLTVAVLPSKNQRA